LTAARRSGQVVIATGGSGGNMKRSSGHEKPQKPKPPPSKGVDRSLHISYLSAWCSLCQLPTPCSSSYSRRALARVGWLARQIYPVEVHLGLPRLRLGRKRTQAEHLY
jgi:hypothetical protein